MASWFSWLNPVPSFPKYTGPYKVGSVDAEIPISEFTSPSPTPEGADDIHTIQFRIYYPATPASDEQPITWLPQPQRLHLSFYSQFLGLGALAANILSYIPRYLHYITIPVHKNAALLRRPDTTPGQSRWPTVVFSHGLGGSRNAYSHLAGSLASHGVVVICPEHRDGSAIVSMVRHPQNSYFLKYPSQVFPCIRIPHTNTPEVWAARDKQMRIRLWELGINLEAINALDKGDYHIIKYNMNSSTPSPALSQFTGMLDIQEPGKIIFGGHSFGAATIVQLLKTTYYAERPELATMSNPLFTPSKDSFIRRQITSHTPSFLLDMWCFQLLSTSTTPLYNLPLPAYDNVPGAPGGKAILAIESEAFYKWKDHLHSKARILSPNPATNIVTEESFTRPDESGEKLAQPRFYYVQDSAHINQSDFGLLFPWMTKKIFGGSDPERVMRLNVRAILQSLREHGVKSIADTGRVDLVEGGVTMEQIKAGGVADDEAILDGNADGAKFIKAWVPIDIVGMGGEAGPTETELLAGQVSKADAQEAGKGEKEMEKDIEPGLGKENEKVEFLVNGIGIVESTSVKNVVGAEAA